MNYIRIYNELMEKATERIIPDEYFEVHHIVPSSLGGSNHPHNLVKLTFREHFIAHCLLFKIFGDDQIFSIECFYDHTRTKFYHIRVMKKWIRRHIAIRRAELKREYKWTTKSTLKI